MIVSLAATELLRHSSYLLSEDWCDKIFEWKLEAAIGVVDGQLDRH